MTHAQPSANGRVLVSVVPPTEGPAMLRVKFLKDTRHPDHGEIKKGEVLLVSAEYARDYKDLGLAHETTEPLTER